jgi:hypothetical protein
MVEAKAKTEWFFPTGGCHERDGRLKSLVLVVLRQGKKKF